jgi:hypothetical protein
MSTTQTVKHTPGDWSFWQKYQGEDIASIRANGKIIADVVGQNSGEGVMKDEALANAKLIAAAPDLLKALKEMLRHTDGNCAEEPMTTLTQAELEARAAIEKATV